MVQAINIKQNTNTLKMPATQLPQLPTAQKNYTVFDQKRVDYFVSQKEQALPYLKQVLETSQDEKQIVEALYIVDRLIDKQTKGIPAMYPILAKFNNTQSPNIQTFLAGIYRKTQVPDAFGPLVKMLIQNSVKNDSKPFKAFQSEQPAFDPNEEIGGAILAYISNYSKGTPKIDYTA